MLKRPRHDQQRLLGVKAVHTFVWFIVEAAMVYVIGAGLRGRTDRRVAIASGIVAAESLVFTVNGFRCPLTTMAESLGAEDGAVTDIFLPRWFAKSLPMIHAPLLALAVGAPRPEPAPTLDRALTTGAGSPRG